MLQPHQKIKWGVTFSLRGYGARCKSYTALNYYRQYIVRDPAICGGEPVVKGTRVTVGTVLASLAEGMSVAEIVKYFPTLDEEAVRAVIAFAAASAEEDLPIPPAPSHA